MNETQVNKLIHNQFCELLDWIAFEEDSCANPIWAIKHALQRTIEDLSQKIHESEQE